jgi:hypothetical protein
MNKKINTYACAKNMHTIGTNDDRYYVNDQQQFASTFIKLT